jgi:hypothetical protein
MFLSLNLLRSRLLNCRKRTNKHVVSWDQFALEVTFININVTIIHISFINQVYFEIKKEKFARECTIFPICSNYLLNLQRKFVRF